MSYPRATTRRAWRCLRRSATSPAPRRCSTAWATARSTAACTTSHDYCYEESLAIRTAIGDRWGMASRLSNLGWVAHLQSDFAAARARYEESLAIVRAIGDRRGAAIVLNNLGFTLASCTKTARRQRASTKRCGPPPRSAQGRWRWRCWWAWHACAPGPAGPSRRPELLGLALRHPASNSDVKDPGRAVPGPAGGYTSTRAAGGSAGARRRARSGGGCGADHDLYQYSVLSYTLLTGPSHALRDFVAIPVKQYEIRGHIPKAILAFSEICCRFLPCGRKIGNNRTENTGIWIQGGDPVEQSTGPIRPRPVRHGAAAGATCPCRRAGPDSLALLQRDRLLYRGPHPRILGAQRRAAGVWLPDHPAPAGARRGAGWCRCSGSSATALSCTPTTPAPTMCCWGRSAPSGWPRSSRTGRRSQARRPRRSCLSFAATSHAICGSILRTWRASGLNLDSSPAVSEAEAWRCSACR